MEQACEPAAARSLFVERTMQALKTVPAPPEDGRECPICLEKNLLEAPSTAVMITCWKQMPCGHCFHQRCLESWVANDMKKKSCPVCRSSAYAIIGVCRPLRPIVHKHGMHLLGANHFVMAGGVTRPITPGVDPRDYLRNVLIPDQALRVAGGLLAHALSRLLETTASAAAMDDALDAVNGELDDALAALRVVLGRRAEAESACRLVRRCCGELATAKGLLRQQQQQQQAQASILLLPCAVDTMVDALRLAAVRDLEAALREARAGAEITTAALRDAGWGHV